MVSSSAALPLGTQSKPLVGAGTQQRLCLFDALKPGHKRDAVDMCKYPETKQSRKGKGLLNLKNSAGTK